MSTTTANGAAPTGKPLTAGHKKVIFASSLGTVFEWYDFYLYGSLAAIIAKQFFSGVNDDHRLHLRPAGLRRRLRVRPFGALVFGRLGDMVGRKYTFLVTIVIMGVVDLPGRPAAQLRHHRRRGAGHPDRAAPAAGPGAGRRIRRRGDLRRRACAATASAALYTSWIQTTATLGLFLSLLVILALPLRTWATRRSRPGAGAFRSWSRSCCWASRCGSACSCSESPLFQKMKAEGKLSQGAADRDPSANGATCKIVLLALFGADRRARRWSGTRGSSTRCSS